MKLELNNSGAWKTVLVGIRTAHQASRAAEAAAELARLDAEVGPGKPMSWRLVSEVDGRVTEYCCGADGWREHIGKQERPDVYRNG